MSAPLTDDEAEYARIRIIQEAFYDLPKGLIQGGITPHQLTQAIAGFVALSILQSYGGSPYAKTCLDEFFQLVSSAVEAGSRCMQQRAIQ
jgi:hypothetical protein